MFDVYIRVSRTGDRTDEELVETYRAQCYEWASRNGITIDQVVEDTDVSGQVAVRDRGLEDLLLRVEAGESEGVVTPYLDRLGRDVIESARAYKRINDAGGRLVCVKDGQDSDRPGDEMVFKLRATIAEDYNRRIEANFRDKRDARRPARRRPDGG